MKRTLVIAALWCLAGCEADYQQQPTKAPPPPPAPPAHAHVYDDESGRYAPPPTPPALPASPQSAEAEPHDWNHTDWKIDQAQRPLDMSIYAMNWHDEFDRCDVVNDTNGRLGYHNWYAQTNNVMGLATMVGVGVPNSPIACNNGQLELTLSNPAGGQWQGALLRGQNRQLEGHSQLRGYWEARIKLPSNVPHGLIPWPSFWFENRPPNQAAPTSYTEVDTFEAGLVSATDLTAQATTLHEWPAKYPQPSDLQAHLQHSFRNHYAIFDDQWHTYGFRWTTKNYIFYRDGLEIARHRIPYGEKQVAMYPELDIGIHFDPSHASPSAHYTMYVDYVRRYQCVADASRC